MLLNQDEPLLHFSLSTLLLPRGHPAHPSAVYLNHRCVSFEKEVSVPFTASFAVQLLSLHPSASLSRLHLIPSKRFRREIAELTTHAIEEEFQRRTRPLLSFPSYASLASRCSVASVASVSSVASEDHPLLWKGAQEPAPSRPAGLLLELWFARPLTARQATSDLSPQTSSPLRTVISTNRPLDGPSARGPARVSARPSARHRRSMSDPFAQALPVMSDLSLAYEMDSLKEGEALNFSLPSDAKAPVRTRRLTEEEKEELGKEDPLFVDAEPVDRIVSVSGVSTEVEEVPSEVVVAPLPRESSDPFANVPAMLAKLTTEVNVGNGWKRRLVVVATGLVRVMRTLESNEVKAEANLAECGEPVLRKAEKVALKCVAEA